MGRFYSDALEEGLRRIYLQSDPSRYQEGVRLLQQAVDTGEAAAHYYLARCYGWGDGNVTENSQLARHLLTTGIQMGSALCVLGADRMQIRLPQMPLPLAEAFESVEKLAQDGEPLAQYTIGGFYYWQDISELQQPQSREAYEANEVKNIETALQWYEKSALQGCIPAFRNAFAIYENKKCPLAADRNAAIRFIEQVQCKVDIPSDFYANIAGLYSDLERYAEARHWLEAGMQKNDGDCYNNLGNMYYYGQGVPEDNDKAVALFREGATLGNMYATYGLARCYCYGHGVEEDNDEAFRLFSLAAQHGLPDAQRFLAWFYYEGYGTPCDYAKCFHWAKKSVERGNSAAKYFLGKCYLYGQGVRQDCALGRKYLEENAEEAENASAYIHLGHMYDQGLGVPEDISVAVAYYQKALDEGCEDAEQELARFKKGLFSRKWQRR